ncbi:MAG: sigma-70 family RNA polymerase sigma factor [candidate division KSB1 bacterium]|nr:sigma-70 family RNA polymerase sigma factor [candidate division KSB1 bacterium]
MTLDEREKERERIRDAIAGDPKAFEWVIERYRSGLYHLVLRMVRNAQDAEDIVQETFIKAYNALPSFSEEYAFSTWLYKIAINHCIDYLRKRKLPTLSLDRPIEAKNGDVKRELPDRGLTPESTLLRREQHRLIREAIEKLPEHYRVVIVLRHQEEKSYEEIARILGVPLGTVKARIFRARELLKKMLKPVLFP